jgi:hypothetical protein
VELGRRFGVLLGEDFAESCEALRNRYADLRVSVLRDAPAGDGMCAAYRRIVQQLVSAN